MIMNDLPSLHGSPAAADEGTAPAASSPKWSFVIAQRSEPERNTAQP